MSTNGIDYADMFASVQKENTKLREQLLFSESSASLWKERAEASEAKLKPVAAERDELAAQVEVLRCALRGCSGWVESYGEVEAKDIVRAALSITPSAALREIQERTLEDMLSKFPYFSSEEGLWLADAIQAMAADIREGKQT